MMQVLIKRALVIGNRLHVGMQLTHVHWMVGVRMIVALVVFMRIVVPVVIITSKVAVGFLVVASIAESSRRCLNEA